MTPEIYAGLPLKVTYNFNQSRLNQLRIGKEKLIKEGLKHKYVMNEFIFNTVCDEVAKFYEINVDQLIHYKTRKEKYHNPRKLAWVLLVQMHNKFNESYNIASIGYRFNKRSHCTIVTTNKSTLKALDVDRSLKFDFDTIKKEIIKKLEK